MARQAASAFVSVLERDWMESDNRHMPSTFAESLFFFKRGAVGQFSLVIHGRFLGDERHVGGGGTVNGATKDTVVGIGGTSERFPGTASKGVSALLAAPNANGLSLDLLVLTNGAGVLAGSLGHGRARISAD